MILTIGGLVGAGKTTLARRLAGAHGMSYITIGDIMRQMAEKRGMSLNEFSGLAEKDPSIDREIDERQRKSAKDNCIFDSRLSAFLIKADIKIWLTAPLEVRAERVAKREGAPLKEALNNIRRREESERKRYKGFYKIDLNDLSVYDLVLNTAYFTPDDMFRICDLVVTLAESQ